MMRWRLRELMGQYQSQTGDKITYEEITEATGLSPNTLSKVGTNKAGRTDLETLERLLYFFSEKLGRELDTGDLLAYLPTTEDDNEAEDDALAAHADKILAGVRSGKVRRVSEAEVDAKLIAAGLLDD